MSSILIVEDDAIVRELLFELFSEEHACQTAETAKQALVLLDSVRFNVVLTDISMPGMSGLELLGQIRQRWPETAVIMISGIRDQEYAKGLVKMGASDFLVKPFDLGEVKESVDRALKQQQPLAAEQPAEDVAPPAPGAHDEQSAAVFSSIQLDKVFSLCELIDMTQRSRMSGHIQLAWNDATIEKARQTGRFQDAGGNFDEAVLHGSGCLYFHEGLLVDATIDEREASPYWRDAEHSLCLLVRLATWVNVGVRAWGFATPDQPRAARLSVTDNSGKLLSIITEDEGAADEPVAELTAAEEASGPVVADEDGQITVSDTTEFALYNYWAKEQSREPVPSEG